MPQQPTGHSERQQVSVNPELAEEIKKEILRVRGVGDSVVVVINKDVSAAVKVSGFNRLRLHSIKKEAHQKIKELNKDFNVHVTSDKKIFAQLKQIEGQIYSRRDKPPADIKNKVEKLNKDMQG